MITTFYPPYSFGGDGIFVHRLANELAKRGHQVDVIHCLDSYHLFTNQVPAKRYENHSNVTVHGLKSKFSFLSPLATHQTGFPLFKSMGIHEILAKHFDVIHYHNISLVGGIKILAYGRGIKLYTMHEYWLVCPTHVLFRFNRAVCTRPHCIICGLIYRRPPQWWRYFGLLKSTVKHLDAFVAPSRFSKKVHDQLGLDVPIVHLPHFVPSTETEVPTGEKALEEPPEKPYFLFVGRLEKLKGLQTLIPIFRRYCNALLLIAGTGSYEARLRQLADGTGNIRFLGHLSSRHLQEFYRQAVAVIVPSLCFEVFPLAILEAFRQQTPVIARNLGTMPEIIGESGGGVIYDTKENLVAKLDQLLADPSLRRILGQKGHQAYQQKWTIDNHLQHYFSLIHEIAEMRNQSLN